MCRRHQFGCTKRIESASQRSNDKMRVHVNVTMETDGTRSLVDCGHFPTIPDQLFQCNERSVDLDNDALIRCCYIEMDETR
ncbi:hypothetical protein RDWZM_005579 [Blomia tropicalis]|uniref:Uncharacterized protein n=1 Tax=Blomia tropicalis TaxID=40697 RepID=A0A9Q0M8P8_BLOTA|nr:hypothetical protein RDWZM_005579 [Blomia tropicalis]